MFTHDDMVGNSVEREVKLGDLLGLLAQPIRRLFAAKCTLPTEHEDALGDEVRLLEEFMQSHTLAPKNE